jgi:hypothetical protein
MGRWLPAIMLSNYRRTRPRNPRLRHWPPEWRSVTYPAQRTPPLVRRCMLMVCVPHDQGSRDALHSCRNPTPLPTVPLHSRARSLETVSSGAAPKGGPARRLLFRTRSPVLSGDGTRSCRQGHPKRQARAVTVDGDRDRLSYLLRRDEGDDVFFPGDRDSVNAGDDVTMPDAA